jgi:hypothetical protein
MFEQLEYLRHHQPALGVFEQVPNFQLMHGGAFMREFVEASRRSTMWCPTRS